MNKGDVSLVLAQKPFDMGYMAVEFAAADAAGVTSLPKRVRDWLRHHRQDQCHRSELRALHLPGAGQIDDRRNHTPGRRHRRSRDFCLPLSTALIR